MTVVVYILRHVDLGQFQGGQMVVLGKASDARVEREFEGLAKLVKHFYIFTKYTAIFFKKTKWDKISSPLNR